jgi:hypothetical protein
VFFPSHTPDAINQPNYGCVAGPLLVTNMIPVPSSAVADRDMDDSCGSDQSRRQSRRDSANSSTNASLTDGMGSPVPSFRTDLIAYDDVSFHPITGPFLGRPTTISGNALELIDSGPTMITRRAAADRVGMERSPFPAPMHVKGFQLVTGSLVRSSSMTYTPTYSAHSTTPGSNSSVDELEDAMLPAVRTGTSGLVIFGQGVQRQLFSGGDRGTQMERVPTGDRA